MSMTNKEILSNAIDKAIANGWNKGEKNKCGFDIMQDILVSGAYYQFIFSHSFAKAFWGEEPIDMGEAFRENGTPAYIYYLMEMVREEEPLKYLEGFL